MASKTKENLKTFTYGHQFEPGKADLLDYLKLCESCAPSRKKLEDAIRANFVSSHSGDTSADSTEDNQAKLAMNCFLSLRAYGLVESTPPSDYHLTELSKKLIGLSDNTDLMLREFQHFYRT